MAGLAESSALLLFDKASRDLWQINFSCLSELPHLLPMQHMGYTERLKSREF